MILTCPACATQYRLKEGAIPPEGRQVRCAACKHKWHQDGEASAIEAPPAEAGSDETVGQWPVSGEQGAGAPQDALGGPPQPDEQPAKAPLADIPAAAADEQMIADTPEPEVAAPAPAGQATYLEPAAGGQWGEPSDPYPEEQGFAAIPAMHDEDEPRRSKLPWILGLILIVVAAAAAFWFLAPAEMRARAGIAESGESPLEVIITTRDRQRLASGNELLAISGRVINSTDREQAIPPIRAELRNETTNKLVYQWTIAPPARSLAPGAAASFNSAEVDVPAGADLLSLRFAS